MRQYALTMERLNSEDKGCEYYEKCLECPFPICVREEMSDKKRAKYLREHKYKGKRRIRRK